MNLSVFGNNKTFCRKVFDPEPSPIPGSFSFLGIMESLAMLSDD